MVSAVPHKNTTHRKSEKGIVLTPAQKRAQRNRSVAIALMLVGVVVLFYFVTLVKGPGILHRPL